MFEISTALTYLIPRRKQLSVSLISLMAVLVISLVVWLVLVFLSVTEGIERSWMEKLTKLNAPIKINPTPAYYSSYYYQIDALSNASNFCSKSIGEKLRSIGDPYLCEEDGELPPHFPAPDRTAEGTLRDPVHLAFGALEEMRAKHPSLIFQDYEIGAALLRLQMLRPTSRGGRAVPG